MTEAPDCRAEEAVQQVAAEEDEGILEREALSVEELVYFTIF